MRRCHTVEITSSSEQACAIQTPLRLAARLIMCPRKPALSRQRPLNMSQLSLL